MVQLNWPIIHRHRSQNALNHLASLEADFEALDACVKLSVSKRHRLPSSLRNDISKAILEAFADHDYPYEISEADRTLVGGLILKHITAEAAERARDRIPLRQYHDLRKSFQQLVKKINTEGSQPHPEATAERDEREANNLTEPSPELETMHAVRASLSWQREAVRLAAPSNRDDTNEGAGQANLSRGQEGDATKVATATDRPKKKGRKRKKHGEVRQAKGEDYAGATGDGGGILETMGKQHSVEEADVHEGFIDSGVETDDHEDLMRIFKDTEAQCEYLRLQLQGFESGQLEESTWHVVDDLMEDEDMVEKNVVEEDDACVELLDGGTLVNYPSDLSQWPNNQADNQTKIESNEQIPQGREVKQELVGLDASTLITFKIEHQAAVNKLDDMGYDGILQRLSSSLETMKSLGHDASDYIHFTNAMLLNDGNVEVHAHAASKEDIERLSRIRGWDFEFEKSIYAPDKSYAVETSRVSVDSFNMQTRKHKARAIRALLEENLRFVVSLQGVDDIRDIRWCKGYKKQIYKKESGLIIEFRTAQQADEVLSSSIFIRGKPYTCQSVEQKLLRCGRCQAFGHNKTYCLSAHRCGRCALRHATSECTSNIRLCANCHGPHAAKAAACPAREAHKQRLRYTYPSSPVREEEHGEPDPESQSRTVAFKLPSPNPMPITPHDEGEIKVEEDEWLQNSGPLHQRGYAKAEGGELTQEMSIAQNHHPEFGLIQRQLQDLRKVVERLSAPQHRHPQRRKRGADEMPMGGPSSNARKEARRGEKKQR